MLAPRISEYGMITMGFVGKAKYGGDGVTTAGLLEDSGGLCERLFDTFVFIAWGAGGILNQK